MRGYPRWFPHLLGATALAISLTGMLLATNTLVLRANVQLGWNVSGPMRTWTSGAHAWFGFMFLSICGALWSIHMRAGWRRREQRRSGSALGFLLLALAITAIGIYYSGDASLADWLSYIHLSAGLALTAILGWHWVHGRRLRRAHGRR